MFELQAGHPLYQRCGLLLLLLQFSLFIIGLPPFQVGIWPQSEAIVAAIFICGILNSLWLALGLGRKFLTCTSPRPLVLWLMAWVAWQVIATAMATSFWRSWFGPAELGEGTGRSIALLLLVATAYPLWQIRSCRELIILCAGGGIALQCILFWLAPFTPATGYTAGTWVPAHCASYLAFMAASFWLALVMSGILTKRAHYAWLILFTVIVLHTSFNRSAMVLVGGGIMASIAAWASMRSPLTAKLCEAGRIWRALALLACFLPMAWIAFSVCYGNAVEHSDKSGFFGRILSKEGLGSNISLNQIGVAAMQHEPHRWLAGDGWGRFTDDAFKYALIDGVQVFHNGARNANMPPVEGSVFHSHNEPLEVLLSLGLPGLVLWFAFPVIALVTLPKNIFWKAAPMLVALVALSYVWFETPHCLAYDALLIVAFSGTCRSFPCPQIPVNHRSCLAIVAACGVAMVWSTLQQAEAISYGSKFMAATEGGDPYTNYPLEWLASDLQRGGDRLHAASINYTLWLHDREAIDANDLGWYTLLMEAAHIAASSPDTGARVTSTELWLQYKLLLDFGGFHSFAASGHETLRSMPGAAFQLCRKAPLRDDYETLFLINLPAITHHNTTQQEAILMTMLNLAPGHRPAMFLLGQLLAQEKSREGEGNNLIKNAALRGVDTVYPVSNNQLRKILFNE